MTSTDVATLQGTVVPEQEGYFSQCLRETDEAKRRLTQDGLITAAELAERSQHYLEQLLWGAIERIDPARVQQVLADPRMTPAFLNRRHISFHEGDQRVTYLSFAAGLASHNEAQTTFKLEVVALLLKAGATNVNEGYYLMGVSGYTAFMAACDARLWPGIAEELHRAMVGRMYAVGGKPNYGQHPLDHTARKVAEKYAPYLLDLLPLNEEVDGQRSLFANKADMPSQFSPGLIRHLNTGSWVQEVGPLQGS